MTGEETAPCRDCGSTQFTPDQDVLDTWFSSWLWPFSTLGWPEETKDLATFYPTDDLVTGPDIIFFWVARMVMAGYEFTGKKPFSLVHLHGLVRDEQGRKMSKSLGNSPDPIDLIDQYGADALRFTMLLLTPTGTDVLFGEKKIEIGRNFANKLWNAARFALMNLGEDTPPAPVLGREALADRWLASRLARVIGAADRKLDEMQLNDVARDPLRLHLARVLRLVPRDGQGADQRGRRGRGPRARRGPCGARRDPEAAPPADAVHHRGDRSHVPLGRGPLIVEAWPKADDDAVDEEAEEDFEILRELVVAVRNLRSEMNVPPGREADVTIRAGRGRAGRAGGGSLHPRDGADLPPPRRRRQPEAEHAASAVAGDAEVFVHLEGLIDLDLERNRLRRDLEKTEKPLASARRKLENQDFLEKAKPEVVETEREKIGSLELSIDKLQAALSALEE